MESNYFGAAPTATPAHPLRRPSDAPTMGFKDAPRVVAGRGSVMGPASTHTTQATPIVQASSSRRPTATTFMPEHSPPEGSLPSPPRRQSMMPPPDEENDMQVHDVVESREQRIQSQLRAFGVADVVQPMRNDSLQDMTPSRRESLLQARRGLVQCTVYRRKPGLLSRDPTSYHMSPDRAGEAPDFYAIKRPHKPTTNYSIATTEGDYERGTAGFVGKVRANFSGTEFVLYDDGNSPKDGGTLRRELVGVVFEPNPLGAVGPRRMTVLLPRLRDDDTPVEFRPPFVTERPSIILEYETAKRSGTEPERIAILETKPPTWNETLKVYQANFHNRVHVPSIKNFQLCDPRNPSRVLLQFGRQDSEGNFALDFQYPFTPLQAFAVALTVFDNKLLAE